MRNLEILQKSNKDILAKLMATEDITVLHKRVPTAYFDVKNRTLVCPIFKNGMSPELTDLFMGHEVGHALNTPAEGWHGAVSDKGQVFKGYLNVIEDVRIEKMVKDKYPGLRKSFYTGYRELANKDFFGIKGKNLNELNLIDKINLFYKIGSVTRIEFSKEEQVYIDKCENLNTFDDVMSLALELFERQQQQTKEQLDSMTDIEVQDMMEDLGIDENDNEDNYDTMSVETEETEDNEDVDGGSSEADSDNDGEESDESSSSNDGEKPSEEDVESSDSNSPGKGTSPEQQLADSLNKSISDESFREQEDSLYDTDSYGSEPTYYELLDKIKYDNFIVSSKEIDGHMNESKGEKFNREILTKTVKDFQETNKKIINYMVKEFEMKKAAASYNRSWESKSGQLNMDKLHLYKLKDDLFNRVQVTPEGKNHGVVMLLDWSGSMSGSVRSTMEQATLLSMFCRRLQIPFRLFAFSDCYMRYGSSRTNEEAEAHKEKLKSSEHLYGKELKTSQSEWDLGTVKLLEIYNEKMSNREFSRAMENWFQLASQSDCRYHRWDEVADYDTSFWNPNCLNLSGTPLDHSLVLIRDYINDFKTQYNLDITSLVTLTDGASHNVFYSNNISLVDKKNNKVIKLDSNDWRDYNRNEVTHSLLNWVQDTTGCRTIGFYISDSPATHLQTEAARFGGSEISEYDDNYKDLKKEYTNLATTFTDGVYDLAIIINQKKLQLNYNEDELNVNSMDEGANKGTLKRALVKAGNNKMKQRVILNKFVGQMAV